MAAMQNVAAIFLDGPRLCEPQQHKKRLLFTAQPLVLAIPESFLLKT
jgi:hypothetical protein